MQVSTAVLCMELTKLTERMSKRLCRRHRNLFIYIRKTLSLSLNILVLYSGTNLDTIIEMNSDSNRVSDSSFAKQKIYMY